MNETTKKNRWKDNGLKPILVATSKDEHQKIRVAAAAEGVPMSHFLLLHGLTAAKKILENMAKSS